jgi:mannose-6-phosphate isomerase-like protein (cupin superfamily)
VPDREPQRVEKPWGHEVWWAETEHYVGKLLYVDAGHELSLQVHHEKDEASYLLSGRLRLTHGPSEEALSQEEISPGQTWRIAGDSPLDRGAGGCRRVRGIYAAAR